MKRLRRLYITGYGLTPVKRVEDCGILCEDDRILAVGGESGFSLDEPDLEIYRIAGGYAMPGFIDSHIHGAGGFDASTPLAGPRTLDDMSLQLARRGVTTFVPTVVAAKPEDMLNNLAALSAMMKTPCRGADAVGIHIEGPFLNPERRGSQQFVRPIDLGFAKELLSAGGGLVRRMTFAPELPGALDLIEMLVTFDVGSSMGHSQAGEADTIRAIDAGARCCTHLFNGMPPLHQREITLTAIALTDDRVTTELISDGRHIDPRMVNLACRCKPADKVVAISDATMAAGMPDGEYRIGPAAIVSEAGFTHTREGKLAGTTTMLDAGWHALMNYSDSSECLAAQSVTLNAARSLQLYDRGELFPRTRADIAVFEYETNKPLLTVCNGRIVFSERDFLIKKAEE